MITEYHFSLDRVVFNKFMFGVTVMLTVAALLEPSLNLVFIIITGALVPAAEILSR